jgi:hypothetical protein
MTVTSVAAVCSTPAEAQMDMSCLHRGTLSEAAQRPSPLDSVMFTLDGHDIKICYSRPSARGRTMIGGDAVPFGEIWRTGANEVTLLRASVDVTIAGVDVPAGTYSIYTVPGESEWEVIVNASYSQWGHTRTYTDEVRAQEIGRGRVPSEQTETHVETFTIRAESGTDSHVVFEWERTRVRVPIFDLNRSNASTGHGPATPPRARRLCCNHLRRPRVAFRNEAG